jgi:hypothetical protein
VTGITAKKLGALKGKLQRKAALASQLLLHTSQPTAWLQVSS